MKNFVCTRPASQTTRPQTEKGQGLVELALVIPVLVVIVVGLLDLGRAYFSVIIINNAAREGARYLSSHRSDLGDGFSGTINAAMQEAQGTIVTLTPGDIHADCTDNDSPSDGKCDTRSPYSYPVSVTVRTTFNPIFWPGTFTFTRSASMLVP
jgi:Flp pilus assembly protein TadG